MEVIVGTYEELILGYSVDLDVEKNSVFETSFTDHSHLGCVKTTAVSCKGILATGSTDETIRLFNLVKRCEIGSLVHHSGTITNLKFFKKDHMFSSSEDGSICVWKVGKWECLKKLRGHQKAVSDIAVHPSGKVALSVGMDRTCRLWNLITGKSAYTKAMRASPDLVLWSPKGDYYVVSFNHMVDVYNTETAKVCHTLEFSGRIHTMCYIEDSVLVVTGEGGEVHIHDVASKSKLASFSTDTIRVKGMAFAKDSSTDDSYFIFTGSSDGYIKMWTLNTKTWEVKLKGEHDTKFRITCLALKQKHPQINQSESKAKKTKQASKSLKDNSSSEGEAESEAESEDDEDSDVDNEDEEEEEEEEKPVQKVKHTSQKVKNGNKKRKSQTNEQGAVIKGKKRRLEQEDSGDVKSTGRKAKKKNSNSKKTRRHVEVKDTKIADKVKSQAKKNSKGKKRHRVKSQDS